MSIDNLMKMRCSIYRKTSTKDNYENFTYSWGSPIDSYAKCNIQNFSSTYAKLKVGDMELEPGNLYIGTFDKDQDIKEGDRVNCNDFDPSSLYVISVNPVMRGTTGIIHHKKVLLDIEET
jgi:hypothetical protein